MTDRELMEWMIRHHEGNAEFWDRQARVYRPGLPDWRRCVADDHRAAADLLRRHMERPESEGQED